jgi:hypothetical protein
VSIEPSLSRILPPQNSHRRWVIEQIHRRPHAYNLGRACFIDRTLPEEIAIQEFGEIRVDVAREAIIGEAPTTTEACTDLQLLPSCLGVTGAFDSGAPTCVTCPASRGCNTLEQKVKTILLRKCKSDDPVGVRTRALGRRRVERWRANHTPSGGSHPRT